MITITIANAGQAPVLCQYPQQSNPQPAYLFFRPGNDTLELVADYSSEIGSCMSFDVFHRRELRFSISPYASRASLEDLASDEKLEAMLQKIHDAYSCEWDGNNHVGKFAGLDDDFELDVDDYLRGQLAEQEVWRAEDWMDTDGVIENLMTHGSISAYADDMIDRAEAPIIGDMEDAVAQAVSSDVEHYIRSNTEASADIKAAAQMLRDYDEDKYGYLLADYIEEFESDEE